MSKVFLLLMSLPGLLIGTELMDPTRPPDSVLRSAAVASVVEQQDTALILSGIFLASWNRSALINGHRVEVGQQVGGARVVSINPGEVQLERNGQRISLSLLGSGIKRKNNRSGDKQ